MSKCEVAGIGSLQRVKMAVCGIKCTDFTTNYENYNQKLQIHKDFVKCI